MSHVYTPSEVLVAQRCGECGVWFGMTEFFFEKRKSDGEGFYCPNGHSRVFCETDADRLRKAEQRLAEERRRVKATRDLLAAEERSHSATRGHLTRQKKRVAAGVCPCCGRTFQQLARHMANKHPDFGAA